MEGGNQTVMRAFLTRGNEVVNQLKGSSSLDTRHEQAAQIPSCAAVKTYKDLLSIPPPSKNMTS